MKLEYEAPEFEGEAAELFSRAKKRAMYILGARDHSRFELFEKLLKNYPEEIAEAAVEWVDYCGYLDDEAYAGKLCRSLIIGKKYGKHKVKWELKRRGLPPEVSEAALDEYGDEDMREVIMTLLRGKYRGRLGDYSDNRKVVQALAARGFAYDDIGICIDEVMEEIEEE